jgi:hypothetical protein
MMAVVAGLVFSGCNGSKPKAETPDAAVRNIQTAIIDCKPDVVFTALPPSYQADINALVVDLSTRMDAELWNEATGVIKQAVGIIDSKRDLILSSEILANKEDIKNNWDTGISMLKLLVNSDFMNLERLRKGNIETFLASDGAAIMKKMSTIMENSKASVEAAEELAKIKSTIFSTVSQEGDTAVIKVEAPNQEPETYTMTKIEGVWFPKDLADKFQETIAEARKGVEQIDFSTEEGKLMKTAAMQQINMAKPFLAQLEAAKTKEELQAVMNSLMMTVMMGAMQ